MTENRYGSLLDFLNKAEKLKETYRFSAHEPLAGKESSADHSWRVALLASLIHRDLELDLDLRKAIEMILIHDLPHSITKDIDEVDVGEDGRITKEQQYELESKAIGILGDIIDEGGDNFISPLWKEYADADSREAKFVHALSRIETILHLIEEGHEKYDDPEIIAHYADEAVENFPELKPLLKDVKKSLRQEFEKGDIEWKGKYDRV